MENPSSTSLALGNNLRGTSDEDIHGLAEHFAQEFAGDAGGTSRPRAEIAEMSRMAVSFSGKPEHRAATERMATEIIFDLLIEEAQQRKALLAVLAA